jgi:SAM-dependent methyltransferase
MRILDLGCGFGSDLTRWGVTATDEITGVDIDDGRVEIARSRFPGHTYLRANGEQLPFENGQFDRIISSVALPYMDIPKALEQIIALWRQEDGYLSAYISPALPWESSGTRHFPSLFPRCFVCT